MKEYKTYKTAERNAEKWAYNLPNMASYQTAKAIATGIKAGTETTARRFIASISLTPTGAQFRRAKK